MTSGTIKAAVTENNQLALKQVPRPAAVKGSIVIKNKVAGINYADLHQVSGHFPVPPSKIVGLEGAGEVVEVGEGITQFKVGDRVVGLGGGSHAEYFLIAEAEIKAAKIPDNVSYETAASLGIQGLTAITLVNHAYNVQKGEKTLIHAAAGGVGSLLIQLIHQKGATVIASVGSDEKAEFVKKLGADHVINYKKENLIERVLEITNGQGVNLSLDSVGGPGFVESIEKIIAYNGAIISFGSAAGPPPAINISTLYTKNIRVQGSSLFGYFTTQQEANKWWALFFDLIGQGKLKETIYKIYPLDSISQAFDDIKGGQTFGKLLVKID